MNNVAEKGGQGTAFADAPAATASRSRDTHAVQLPGFAGSSIVQPPPASQPALLLSPILHVLPATTIKTTRTMSATGPRTSLLAMFDPLNGAPASPARSDVDLPGGSLSDSDKENDMPPVAARAPGKLVPGATTAFFDRAGAAQAKFGQPRALKSRLVDVGDDSMDVDGADENVDMDIDLDASAQQEADESAKDTPTRVPFAELARAEPTPLTPQKMHAHSPFRRSPLVQMTPRRRSPRLSHSFTSPFAAVIESITSEADTEFCGLPGEEQIQDTSLPFSLGQDSSFERSLSFSHSIHADASFNAPIRISAASPSLSFEDPPASITPSGLQASPIPEFTGSSSFSLKRPSETSFDIVNDKLSFTSAGNDSMYRALEAAHGAQEEEAMLGALAAREVAKMKREGAWIIGEEKSSATSSLELAGSPMKVDRVTQGIPCLSIPIWRWTHLNNVQLVHHQPNPIRPRRTPAPTALVRAPSSPPHGPSHAP